MAQNYIHPTFTNQDNEIANKLLASEMSMDLFPSETFNYENLYSDLKLFIRKMPRNQITNTVSTILNNNGIFAGKHTTRQEVPIYSGALVTTDNKIAGIVLSVNELDINEDTGETDRIDDCVYATYHGAIRGSLKCFERDVRNNFDLHKLCITYLYNLLLRNLGKAQTFSQFKLNGIQIACSYLYFRHYLEYNHSSALSRTSRLFGDVIGKETFKEYQSSMEIISRYKSMKDIGKVLIDLNIVSTNPNQILLSIIQNADIKFFYTILSSLDFLIATIIITKYPSNLYVNASVVNTNLQNAIENVVVQNYLDRVDYSILRG